VILAPSLPIAPGSLSPPSPVSPARPLPQPFLVPNPFSGLWGFSPYWPMWYDSDPIVVTNYIPLVPVPQPPPVSPPAPPPDRKARLVLDVPPSAEVRIGDKVVDAAARPLILESPELRDGQRYAFDVKVSWKERDKTQERSRVVMVDAGESKSLTYTAAK
jgi:hypothetical protein